METETWIDREIRETTERVRVLREYFAETELFDSDDDKTYK